MSTTTGTVESCANSVVASAHYMHGVAKWDDAGDVVSSLCFFAYRRAYTTPAGTFYLHRQRGYAPRAVYVGVEARYRRRRAPLSRSYSCSVNMGRG